MKSARNSLLFSSAFAKGFTLIELLISVAIIAIISSVGFVSYSQSQMVARDAKRKQDLRAIATALEIYRQKNGQYPAETGGWILSNNGSNPWITGGTPTTTLDRTYIPSVPKDPTNSPTSVCSSDPTGSGCYVYSYQNGNFNAWNTPPWSGCPNAPASYYVLMTRLENANDPDTNSNRHYKWCNGADTATETSLGFGSAGWAKLFIITSQ